MNWQESTLALQKPHESANSVKHDTRVNIWFLAIFLAICLPGAVILFRKKLNPNARPIFMSDEMEHRLPYMAPGPTPPGIVRVVPPGTWGFLQKLVSQKTGLSRIASETAANGEPTPILSEDRQLQVVAVRKGSDKMIVDLVSWDAAASEAAAKYTASIEVGGRSAGAQVVKVEAVPLDESVRRDLMNFGEIVPPKRVVWIEVELKFPKEISGDATISMIDARASGQVKQKIKLPRSLLNEP